jgi:serine/threonine protein kinase
VKEKGKAMAAPASTDEFLDLVRKSGVTDERRFDDYVTKTRAANGLAPDASRMAGVLVRDGILTQFQAEQILQGKWRRFTIGKYKVLERIGAGGMGSVYLCEHKLMRRRVAVKVLPTAKASDPASLERFYREARAVAALDHPNIVHAYDIDQDEQLHFLVMEYVDGSNLQDIVKKTGPLDFLRACHYVRQAALGLEHANNAGLVHRDIKPGNILIDRTGVVKILDMGLARFFNDEDDMLTKKFDENVLGTADYLAPEQAIDSHAVDIRADIYSLGATFYFMLTGRTPFGEGTIAQKLLWHQTRQPKPVSEYRKDTPPDLVAIVAKMMDKEPVNRFQLPGDLADALGPLTVKPIGPPPESEMPMLSRAALGVTPAEQSSDSTFDNLLPAPKALQGMGPAGAKPQSGGSKPTYASETTANATAGNNTPTTPKPKPQPTSRPSSAPDAATRPAPTLPTPRRAPTPKEKPPEPGSGDAAFDPAEFTAPLKPNAAKRPAKTGPTSADRYRKRILLAGGAAAILIVVIVAVLVVVKPFAKPPEPPPRKPFEITGDVMTKTGPFTFRKIADALRKVQKGDVILLNDEVHDEQLMLDFSKLAKIPSEVTIQPAPGKTVTWLTNRKDRADLPILGLKGAANLKIQGPNLTFDGTLDALDRLKHIIEINQQSPGLTFENVKFQSFEIGAIKFTNAGGSKDHPIRFVGCEFIAKEKETPKAAVIFDVIPQFTPAQNEFIEFERPQFTGLKSRFIELKAGTIGERVIGVEFSKATGK